MTFLQLVQRLRQETAYADSGPSAVTSQTGAHLRAVNWVIEAWNEIQNRHANWRWLRADFTFNTSASTEEYAYGSVTDVAASAVITRFKSWLIKDPRNPPRCYLTASGVGVGYFLTYIPWEQYRVLYQIGTQSEGAPCHITVAPNNKLMLGPVPDDTYTIEGEYQKSAQVLAADGDTPECHANYHMLIVYRAMEDSGYFENGSDILQRSSVKSRRLMRQLEADQLPMIRAAGPMA